jgi:hypothetical protein
LFFCFVFLLLVSCARQTTPFVVPPNAPDSQQAVQPIVAPPASQEIVYAPSPDDECEYDSDCGFGKRCDYPLCKHCIAGQPCVCPKLCMVITKEGELREAQR